MFIQYSIDRGVLHLAFPGNLDVQGRAAAALEVETLLFAHRPQRLQIQLPAAEPTSAALSVLARVRRLCEGLGIPLTVYGPARTKPPARPAAA
uniref:hypothetical protein n=1 Tax=Streptomyces sp. CA-141956 TaxID=3240051 RepID=UPI003F491CCF